MLWYKAWLETRARFLISVFGMAALCSYSVYHGDSEALPYTGAHYYYIVLHWGHTSLATMWVAAVNLLMMGGLVREKAVGAAAFTLALPVSRTRLLAVRIAAGFLQAMVLLIVPCAAMFLVGSIAGKTHSISQAGYHALLLATGGMLFFGIALLCSSLVEGEYTAPIVSFGVVMLLAVAFNGQGLKGYGPWDFITGSAYWDRSTAQLIGPVPWLTAAVYVGLAGVLALVSVKVIQRREF
jgi:ABC-type transport system involved in multi-copper enzyme maturation permease subunit